MTLTPADMSLDHICGSSTGFGEQASLERINSPPHVHHGNDVSFGDPQWREGRHYLLSSMGDKTDDRRPRRPAICACSVQRPININMAAAGENAECGAMESLQQILLRLHVWFNHDR